MTNAGSKPILVSLPSAEARKNTEKPLNFVFVIDKETYNSSLNICEGGSVW